MRQAMTGVSLEVCVAAGRRMPAYATSAFYTASGARRDGQR